jgi:hypothetical protein
MSMLTRRIIIVPAVLVLALAVGYSALWVAVSHWVEDGFRNWSRVQTSRGNAVEYGPLSLSGFPGPIRLTIAAPHVISAKGGWQWSAGRAELETRPWAWRRYRMEVFGIQNFAVPFGGILHRYSAAPAATLIVGEIDDLGRLSQGFLQAGDIQLKDAAGTDVLSAKNLSVHLTLPAPTPITQDQTAAGVTLQAHSVLLGASVETPLDRQIQDIGMVATVKGALPETFLRDAVDAWRLGGGTVEVSHFQVDWGKLSLRATGTASLDESFRPLAALTADIKGYAETLAALERARVLREKAVAGTRLALDLLSRPDGVDGRRTVTIPVTAQNGALYVGPVRLLKLAPIPFPVRPD